MNIFILLDRPAKDNDKKWLVDNVCELSSETVIPIYTKHVLSTLLWSGKRVQKLMAYGEILLQCIKILSKAKRNDAVVCWSYLPMMLIYFLQFFTYKRLRYLAMNWLNPSPHTKFRMIEKRIAKDEKVKIVVNSKELVGRWTAILDINRLNAFTLIPDVYDARIPFCKVKERSINYLFCGGVANRDWGMMEYLAYQFPNVKFVCCAFEEDFRSKVRNTPPNMNVYFNIDSEKYYQLLKDSYMVLLPLCTPSVSGLINIIRSAQEGVICMTSQTPATDQYYGYDDKDLLLPFDRVAWRNKVEEMLTLSGSEYKNRCQSFSRYIKENFSPRSAAQRILSEIQYW